MGRSACMQDIPRDELICAVRTCGIISFASEYSSRREEGKEEGGGGAQEIERERVCVCCMCVLFVLPTIAHCEDAMRCDTYV